MADRLLVASFRLSIESRALCAEW